MTDTTHRSARRRRGREACLLTVGVLACGAVALPVSSALAEDMPDMSNGMLCPHAMGDASNPATVAPPTRTAPNETPLGAKPAGVVTKPSPGRAATRPGSSAPVERASATQPASAPAHATAQNTAQTRHVVAQVVPAPRSVSPIPRQAPVAAPAAQPSHTSARRVPRHAASRHAASARHAGNVPVAKTTVIPDAVGQPAAFASHVAVRATGGQPAGVAWLAIGGLLGLMAFAAIAAARRRRLSVGAVPATAVQSPSPIPAEAMTFDAVQTTLRRLLAQARAQDLLVNAEDGTGANAEPGPFHFLSRSGSEVPAPLGPPPAPRTTSPTTTATRHDHRYPLDNTLPVPAGR